MGLYPKQDRHIQEKHINLCRDITGRQISYNLFIMRAIENNEDTEELKLYILFMTWQAQGLTEMSQFCIVIMTFCSSQVLLASFGLAGT